MQRGEAEDLHRQATMEAFEMVCPNVLGNPFIPHWPLPAQSIFLGLHQVHGSNTEVFQALYGGAAGGGKSDALLMAAGQYAWKHPNFAGIMFRRTFQDLAQPGALLDRAMEWWLPAGVKWEGSKNIFRFPSGAKIAMAFLRAPLDHMKYQGAEYQLTAWDELTQWPDARPYEYVGLSRVRRLLGSSVPLRTLAASNPGGPGHSWVKQKFVGGTNPETGDEDPPDHIYVPARITDNPFLDQVAYAKGLWGLHPVVRRQLMDGDWSAREQGDYFRLEWFGEMLNPEYPWKRTECIRVRWWDLAASTDASASKTAGVRMARHIQGVFAIEHCKAGRWTPGERDDVIIQVAMADGKGVIVGVEIEPGSGGLAQFLSLERRLKAKGYRVVGDRPRAPQTDREKDMVVRQSRSMTGKEGRADPVAAALYRGYLCRGEAPPTKENIRSPYYGIDDGDSIGSDGIRIYSGAWNHAYLDAVEGFPPKAGKAGVDEVDATSGAWAWLDANPHGLSVPIGIETPAVRRTNPDDTPFDQEEDDEDTGCREGQDAGGRWRA